MIGQHLIQIQVARDKEIKQLISVIMAKSNPYNNHTENYQ